jgi:hypothetical protein
MNAAHFIITTSPAGTRSAFSAPPEASTPRASSRDRHSTGASGEAPRTPGRRGCSSEPRWATQDVRGHDRAAPALCNSAAPGRREVGDHDLQPCVVRAAGRRGMYRARPWPALGRESGDPQAARSGVSQSKLLRARLRERSPVPRRSWRSLRTAAEINVQSSAHLPPRTPR